MISLKASEIRELSSDDVARKVAEARQELFNLRFQHATGALNQRQIGIIERLDQDHLVARHNQRKESRSDGFSRPRGHGHL